MHFKRNRSSSQPQGGYDAFDHPLPGPGQSPSGAQPGQSEQPGAHSQSGQPAQSGQPTQSGQPDAYGQPADPGYHAQADQPGLYGQPGPYGQPGSYGQPGPYGQPAQPVQPRIPWTANDVGPVLLDPAGHRRRKRFWGIGAAALAGLLAAGAMFIPVPYVIESPGPTYDVLGKSGDVPFIEVHSDDATYDTSGQLRMVTVSNSGGPFSTVTLGQVLLAKLDPASDILPAEDVYPEDITAEELEEISKAQMTQSQSTAAAAALDELGYPVKGVVRIEGPVKDSPADGKVEEGDILLAIITPDGVRHEVDRPSVPFALARELEPDSTVTMVVERAGKTLEIQSKTYKPEPVPLDFTGSKFGIYLTAKVDLPFEVDIHLERVGGPSAGTMFALGIIDHLTGGDTTGGMIVAGTGSIGYDGQVQPIGGVAQKMHGAKSDGAQWFLAPRSNCDEVVGHVPSGLEVWPVSTLKEAREALASIKAGATKDHPTCEAVMEGK